MDWRRVCRGIDGSRWAVCGDIDGSCSVCAGIGNSRFGALCAINCFGAPLNLAELWAGVSSAVRIHLPWLPSGHREGSVVTGTIYALVDGVIGGAIFGWLYNLFAARKAE